MRKIANQTHTPEVLAQLEWPSTFVDFTARSSLSASAADADDDADAVTPAPVMPAGSTAPGAGTGVAAAEANQTAEEDAAENGQTDAEVAKHLRAHRFILALSSVSDPGNLGTDLYIDVFISLFTRLVSLPFPFCDVLYHFIIL